MPRTNVAEFDLTSVRKKKRWTYPWDFPKHIWEPFGKGPIRYAIRHHDKDKKEFIQKLKKYQPGMNHKWYHSIWNTVLAQRDRVQKIYEKKAYCPFTPSKNYRNKCEK